MILTCPACATRYRVEEQELAAPSGRIVRCANCGHSWREAPPEGGAGAEKALSIGEASPGEPMVSAAPRPLSASRLEIPPHLQRGSPPTTGRRQPAWATRGRAAVIVFLLVALAIAAGVFARRHLAAIWPPVGWLSAIGMPIEPSGIGLTIEKITPVRTADGLTIDGEIANPGSAAESVPRLRIALQNAAKEEVQSEIVDPPKTRLQAGEIVRFATPFANPIDAASRVVVTFVSR